MKNKFLGYYRPTDEQFERLWKNCVFVFDASVLLNLYTYSVHTRESFIGVLGSLGNRIWIPFQVAKEYHRNRLGVIAKEVKRYAEIQGQLRIVVDQLRSRRQHPFIQEQALNELEQTIEKVGKELENGKTIHADLYSHDPVLERLTELFDGKVGDELTEKQLCQIYSEGKERYSKRQPPGYMDSKDKQGDDIYGDLVIWNEVLAEAKQSSMAITFITDDSKEDWWLIHEGNIVSPRPELIAEFTQKTGREFYSYRSDSFLHFASQHLERQVEQNTVDEVRENREADDVERSASEMVGQLGTAREAIRHIAALEKFRSSFEDLDVSRQVDASRKAVDMSIRVPDSVRQALGDMSVTHFSEALRQMKDAQELMERLSRVPDSLRQAIAQMQSLRIPDTSTMKLAQDALRDSHPTKRIHHEDAEEAVTNPNLPSIGMPSDTTACRDGQDLSTDPSQNGKDSGNDDNST